MLLYRVVSRLCCVAFVRSCHKVSGVSKNNCEVVEVILNLEKSKSAECCIWVLLTFLQIFRSLCSRSVSANLFDSKFASSSKRDRYFFSWTRESLTTGVRSYKSFKESLLLAFLRRFFHRTFLRVFLGNPEVSFTSVPQTCLVCYLFCALRVMDPESHAVIRASSHNLLLFAPNELCSLR